MSTDKSNANNSYNVCHIGIREAKEILLSVSDKLGVGMVYQIDSGPDGKQRNFTYLTPAVEKFHGLKMADLIQNPSLLNNQIVEEDRIFFTECERIAFESKTRFEIDVRILMPSGDIRWRRFISVPRLSENGNWLWDGIEIDITDLKQSENLLSVIEWLNKEYPKLLMYRDEQQLFQSKLKRLNRITTLNMLVSSIAHEINNPNNFIATNSKLVSDAWTDSSRILNNYFTEHPDLTIGGIPFNEARYIIPELISAISKGAERIRSIVLNLKNYATNASEEQYNIVDIKDTISSTATLIAGQISKYTDKFTIDVADGLPVVRGSRQQIEQVFLNVILNALQSLTSRDKAVTITCSFDKNENAVVTQICDEGTGMTDDILKQIGEPFFSTRLKNGGTGLGLYISNSIIKEHNGKILFTSTPGAGTKVSIVLPAYHIK